MAELKFDITQTIGVLSENAKGWTKELNLVSWNEREPKYDIREWSPDHTRMGKGVTFTNEEFDILKKLINGEEIEDDIDEDKIL
jgi:hypothetical protein